MATNLMEKCLDGIGIGKIFSYWIRCAEAVTKDRCKASPAFSQASKGVKDIVKYVANSYILVPDFIKSSSMLYILDRFDRTYVRLLQEFCPPQNCVYNRTVTS